MLKKRKKKNYTCKIVQGLFPLGPVGPEQPRPGVKVRWVDASGASAVLGKFSESGEILGGNHSTYIASFDFFWGHQTEFSDFPI